MVYDFHTHTHLSDGVLSPDQLIREAIAIGYKAIAVTDHVGLDDQEAILETLINVCALATKNLGIIAVPGVELTQVAPSQIDHAAKKAKSLGAKIVLVHGETIKPGLDFVEPGTNLAAIESHHVDVLAHPGLITNTDAELAARNGIFLELSSRSGHSLTNGHVRRMAEATGAHLIVNSDTHTLEDLLTKELASAVAQGAGLQLESLESVLITNPLALLTTLDLV